MRVTFLKQKTFILATPQMKDEMERNYILEMTPSQGKMRLKSALQKLNFLMAKAI